VAAIITGGEGDLARCLEEKLSPCFESVYAPGREELDVCCEESVNAFFADVDEPELLICNAGMVDDALLAKMGERQWDDVMAVNLRGAFLCARAVARKMVKRRRGHVVFIGSFSGFSPHVGQANYAAAKAGLVAMAKSLAAELGGKGVRVNVVVPGWLETKMTRGVPEDKIETARGMHALGAFNEPGAVASFIRVLHEEMPYTSGQVFHLDSRILP